jgi:transposase-like protein
MARSSPESCRDRIHTLVAALTPGCQRRYPVRLRRQIADYAQARLQAGVARARVCHELGISDPTLGRVLAEREEGSRFQPVRILPPARKAVLAAGVTVRGPSGLTIEGLDTAGLAALMRALS